MPPDDQLFPGVGEKPNTEKNRTPRLYPQWKALVQLFGEPRMPANQRLYGKVANEFKQAGYDGKDVLKAAKLYREAYPGIAFTITALAKHADQLLHEDSISVSKRRGPAAGARLVVLPDLEAM